MTRSDEAVESFRSGFCCSAAVFSAFSEEIGLESKTTKKIGCGFGGGVSMTGNICGAVSGAIMAIGLKYGKTEEGDDQATEKTRSFVREFINEFTERNGSINCTELLGYNLRNQDEYERACDEGVFKTKCPEYVRDATDILEDILRK